MTHHLLETRAEQQSRKTLLKKNSGAQRLLAGASAGCWISGLYQNVAPCVCVNVALLCPSVNVGEALQTIKVPSAITYKLVGGFFHQY